MSGAADEEAPPPAATAEMADTSSRVHPEAAAARTASVRRRVRRRRRRQTAVWVFVFVALIVLTVVLSPYVLDPAAEAADRIEPSWGEGALFVLATWLTVVPVVPGYTLVLIATGWVFGWFPGLLIAWLGSASGACVTFALSKALFACLGVSLADVAAHRWLAKWRHQIVSVGVAIAQDAFKNATLLQLTFLPYGAIVSLLALTDVSLGAVAASATVSRLPKTAPWVWLGVAADSVSKVYSRGPFALETQDLVIMLVSGVGSIVAVVVVSVHARRVLRREVPGLAEAEAADEMALAEAEEEAEEEAEAEAAAAEAA